MSARNEIAKICSGAGNTQTSKELPLPIVYSRKNTTVASLESSTSSTLPHRYSEQNLNETTIDGNNSAPETDQSRVRCTSTNQKGDKNDETISPANGVGLIEAETGADGDREDIDRATNNSTLNQNSSKRKMFLTYGKEFICILALILTTYATLQNSPPKIARAPPPQQFFSKGSLVHDWPSGQLSATQKVVTMSELAFVIYYAPWCAESQNARKPYEHVAKLYYREGHFAAINCWQPGGECRQMYSKVQTWPILMGYYPSGIGVQYHGSWTNGGLVRFVEAMLNPMKRLTGPDDLLKYMINHDAIVVFFLDMSRHKERFKKFYQTAAKWIEKDPYQEIGFSVVTGETAKKFGVEELPAIRMYLWNETLEFRGNASWSHAELTNWIIDNLHQVSMWLTPSGSKSASLAPYTRQGPVLMLFTPRNLYSRSNDAYQMIRQIGMEYFNCKHDNWVSEMAYDYITQIRQERQQEYNKFIDQCAKLKVITSPQEMSMHTSSVSVTLGNVLNSSKYVENNELLSNDICKVSKNSYDTATCGTETENKYLPHATPETCDTTRIRKFDRDWSGVVKRKTSMLVSKYDTRAPENLEKIAIKKRCELQYFANKEAPTLFFKIDDQSNLKSLSSISCKNNLSISMTTVDSILYHPFAERLGVDVLNAENQTVLFIVDAENESQYVLREPLSINSIVEFLKDFYRRNLQRSKRSGTETFAHTHLFKTKADVKRKEVDTKKSNSMNNARRNKGEIMIKDLGHSQFERVVNKSNKTSVILFYSLQCAFCSIMSQTLLTVSKLLSPIPSVEFYRIDGDRNDLAWHYTMEKFPSLIIFPAKRRSESRQFPQSMRVNVQNVLGFILANTNRSNRLYGLVLSCKLAKNVIAIEDCLNVLRTEIIDNISYSLREWRLMRTRRAQIVRRLQELQNFYLQLYKINHSCDFTKLETIVKRIVQVWTPNLLME